MAMFTVSFRSVGGQQILSSFPERGTPFAGDPRAERDQAFVVKKILFRARQTLRIVLELAQRCIAKSAEQAAHIAGQMIMVKVEALSFRWLLKADRANTSLLENQRVILLDCNAEFRPKAIRTSKRTALSVARRFLYGDPPSFGLSPLLSQSVLLVIRALTFFTAIRESVAASQLLVEVRTGLSLFTPRTTLGFVGYTGSGHRHLLYRCFVARAAGITQHVVCGSRIIRYV